MVPNCSWRNIYIYVFVYVFVYINKTYYIQKLGGSLSFLKHSEDKNTRQNQGRGGASVVYL